MKKQFRNLNELNRFLNNQVKQSLVKDVGVKVKQVMQEHVVDDVYDAYSPTQYERTGELAKEIDVKQCINGVEITPTREDNGRYIPSIIESGQGYSWKGSEIYSTQQKRPFVENTRREIVEKNIHVEELRKSLRMRGFEVK
ncbi:hypothetical protein A616_17405 [Brevibacillus brevis X23]|nr:hypothetical protein A616_17405 [Brevibacillus brevis X23]